MRFRRLIQTISLVLFLGLLVAAIYNLAPGLPVDLFLRLDPGLAAGTLLSARTISWIMVPALVVVLVTLLAGRVFCGYVCPMGTTLDGMSRCLGRPVKGRRMWSWLPPAKYLVLIFILAAAVCGVSLIFLAAPIPLITRFYGLVLHPVLALTGEAAHRATLPLWESLNWSSLVYAQPQAPRFATQLFVLIFFVALFALGRFAPRFWCRYLCPSGALLALFSFKPLVRRRVSEDCTSCGLCARSCPMAAIDPDQPQATRRRECVVCQTCVKVCPVKAVTFAAHGPAPQTAEAFSPGRRSFMLAGLAGAGTAAVSLTGLSSPYGKPGPGMVAPPMLLRPPGSRPEMEFLARCVRCGECSAACPTNTLQPIWLTAGWPGLFSPALTPRRGPCDPHCRRCGEVCPTQAIRLLTPRERVWAKSGTAMIYRQKCLAWEQHKICMVCDEVCPYDAIDFMREPGNPAPVPHVNEDKCAGCGYCEHHCPIQNQAAIVVTPLGALRPAHGSYEQLARSQGLSLTLKPPNAKPTVTSPEPTTAPGFEGVGAPGFEGEGAPGFDQPAPGFDASSGGSEGAPKPTRPLAPGFEE